MIVLSNFLSSFFNISYIIIFFLLIPYFLFFFNYEASEDEDDDEKMNPVEQSVQVIFEKFLRETKAGHLKVFHVILVIELKLYSFLPFLFHFISFHQLSVKFQ